MTMSIFVAQPRMGRQFKTESGGGDRSPFHGRTKGFTAPAPAIIMRASFGGIAQLGERLHGMQEVSGSIPLTSTKG